MKSKKMKAKTKKKKGPPLFMVARRASEKVNDGDTVEARLVCPMCRTHWADANVTFGGHITPDTIRLREPFTSFKVESGKPLSCPACFYRYSNWAVMATVVAAINRENLENSTSLGFRSFGGLT